MMDTISPDKREEVKTKQLEALKRLGHVDLKLDEYERPHFSQSSISAHILNTSTFQVQ
jgi:hypothetical protein